MPRQSAETLIPNQKARARKIREVLLKTKSFLCELFRPGSKPPRLRSEAESLIQTAPLEPEWVDSSRDAGVWPILLLSLLVGSIITSNCIQSQIMCRELTQYGSLLVLLNNNGELRKRWGIFLTSALWRPQCSALSGSHSDAICLQGMSEGLNEDGERKDLKLNLSACNVNKICRARKGDHWIFVIVLQLYCVDTTHGIVHCDWHDCWWVGALKSTEMHFSRQFWHVGGKQFWQKLSEFNMLLYSKSKSSAWLKDDLQKPFKKSQTNYSIVIIFRIQLQKC